MPRRNRSAEASPTATQGIRPEGVAHAASQQLSALLSKVEGLLRAEQMVEPATVEARLIALTDAGMNVEITAMVATTDGNAFAVLRQDLLLGIVHAIEEAACALSHPTRTLSPPLSRELAHSAPPESGDRRPTELAKPGR